MSIPVSLDIDLSAPKQTVKLKSSTHPEGRLYELYYQSDLSMEELARLRSITASVEPLVRAIFTQEDGALDEAESAKLDEWLNEAMGIMFLTKLEPEVLAEMGYFPRWRIVHHFTLHCMDQPETLQEMVNLSKAMEERRTAATRKPAAPKKKSRTGRR